MQQIVLTLAPQEAQACHALLELAIRAHGSQAAKAALPLQGKIEQAVHAAGMVIGPNGIQAAGSKPQEAALATEATAGAAPSANGYAANGTAEDKTAAAISRRKLTSGRARQRK